MRRTHKHVKKTLQLSILLPRGSRGIIERVLRREDGSIRHGSYHQFPLAGVSSSAQLLERRVHVRVRLAGDAHHLPVQPFSIDVWRRRGIVGCFFRGVGALFFEFLGEVFGVVDAPSLLVGEVALKRLEPGLVEEHFAALELLPGAVGAGGGDAVVYPAWGDVVGGLVV